MLPSCPTEAQIEEIERRVNEVIRQGLPVSYEFVSRDEVPPEVDLGKLPCAHVSALMSATHRKSALSKSCRTTGTPKPALGA